MFLYWFKGKKWLCHLGILPETTFTIYIFPDSITTFVKMSGTCLNQKSESTVDFIRPDQPSRCTWSYKTTNGQDKISNSSGPKDNPHTVRLYPERPKIMPDVLWAIGHTPLVRLNKIPKAYGIKCEMLVKCEYLNPGGSVKDRIAYR